MTSPPITPPIAPTSAVMTPGSINVPIAAPTVAPPRTAAALDATLARRLEDMAKGAYIVVREEEVADAKKTDIRIASVRGNHRAAIEIKIADKRWSISDFERALRNQLVGQYLRHENCKVGCLLLTYDGSKKYWQRGRTHERLSFQELISHLKGIAQRTIARSGDEYRLSVVGLDLTDPVLSAAHRK